MGPVWVLRDAERKRGDYRSEEWVALAASPEEVDRIARKRTRGRYAICAICPAGESPDGIRNGYKALGYRLRRTEPFMIHALKRIPRPSSPASIHRVGSVELAERLASASGSRPLRAEFLEMGAPLQQWVAIIDEEIVGWVRSIKANDSGWCDNMYVKPAFRRQGIGRALLCGMLGGDRAAGAIASVLLASHTGAKLYENSGYQKLGTLFLFSPVKAKAP